METQKDLKQTIEEVFEDYSKKSKRELERSKRISRFKNLNGSKTSMTLLLGEIVEKGILMEHAIPTYYFLGGFGNESMPHPNYELWRENSLDAINNLVKSGDYK